MIKVIYVDKAASKIGFISDLVEQGDQVADLHNIEPDVYTAAVKEHLNLPGAGISNTDRAHYDEKNSKLVTGKFDPIQAKLDGITYRSAVIVTFASLLSD